jgi:hypothetical protein
MNAFARHRPAVVAASLVAVLAAGTAVPVAVAAGSAPAEQAVAIDAPSIGEVHAMTSGAADAIEERSAAQQAEGRAEKAARQQAKRAQSARATAAEQASRSAARAAADPRSVAAQMSAERYGWGADQFQCLDSLWTKESGWDYTAANPSSGAYGIPQSLPGNKMASHGADWQTNPVTQISWGLDYISQVYGTPCGAWGHSQAVGWY